MSRRIIVKVICVGAIAIVLLVPLLMIQGLIDERIRYRHEARNDVARSWTGCQDLLGPVLSVPLLVRDAPSPAESGTSPEGEITQRRTHLIFPDELDITASLRTETRRRGLYSVPVYITQLSIVGAFDTSPLAELVKSDQNVVLGDATVAVSVSDNRGIARRPLLIWDQQPRDVLSGTGLPTLNSGVRSVVGSVDPERQGRYAFKIDLELRGMESISFAPVGKDTHVELDATWPHPSFTGRFLPVEYEIQGDRFQAEWNVSHLATGAGEILKQLNEGQGGQVTASNFGVSLINPVDIYQQATRSAKYGNLFIIVTFTAFFLVEIMRKLLLHPMQYLLVGLALVIFFLLLLSLSEHIAFGLAYLIASAACVGLIGVYLSSVLAKASNGIGIIAVLSSLYGMLYAILISEDIALLMGTLLLFALLAVVMIVTRNVDWYKLANEIAPGKKKPDELSTPG